jgi:erythromycin esterase
MRSLVILFLTVGCQRGGIAPGSPPDLGQAPDLAPIAPGVYRLDGIDETLPPGDLQPLAAIVGNAHVVGLGESVHTTDGFTQAKFRTLTFLVEKMGFRALAFEWQRTSGQAVDDYILLGGGSAGAAARGLSVWASRTTQKMIEWLRGWNLAHPDDPVRFFGIDVQQPDDDYQTLAAFLPRAAPADAAHLIAGLDACDRVPTATPSLSTPQWGTCTAGLTTLGDYLAQNKSALQLATTPELVAGAEDALVGLHAWQDEIYYEPTDLKRSMEARDTGMAWMFQRTRAIRFPDARIVLWAHNEHLEQDHASVVNGFGQGSRALGSQLHEALGADYVAIGLTGYDISIDWPDVGCGPLDPPTDPNSVEVMLHRLGAPVLLVDLRAQKPYFDPVTQYGFSFGQSLVPAQQFQALIDLETVPAMQPLDWPKCKP